MIGKAEGCHAGAEWVWCGSLRSWEGFSALKEPGGGPSGSKSREKRLAGASGFRSLVRVARRYLVVTERKHFGIATAVANEVLVLMSSTCMRREDGEVVFTGYWTSVERCACVTHT